MIVNKYKYGGGGSGSGSTYTAGEYIQIAEDVISVTGITPDLYLTTADTQDFATEADITAATSPIQTQLDDIERVTATALTELHNDILEISGSTPDLSNYYTKAETDAEITGATQGFATQAYVENAIEEAMTGFTPELPSYLDQEVLEAKEEVVASALTQLENSILEISGDTPDLSNYYTKAETDAEITGATQGLATQAYVTAATQGFATQAYVTAATSGLASITYVDDAIEEAMTGFTPELPSYLDQEVLEAKEEVIASALTHIQNEILDISGDTPDLSNYYTKAETDAEITGATQGFATQAYVTGITSSLDTRLGYVEGYMPGSYMGLQDDFVYTRDGEVTVQGQNIASLEPVNYVVKCTQSDYDALEAAYLIDDGTLYIIVENQG